MPSKKERPLETKADWIRSCGNVAPPLDAIPKAYHQAVVINGDTYNNFSDAAVGIRHRLAAKPGNLTGKKLVVGDTEYAVGVGVPCETVTREGEEEASLWVFPVLATNPANPYLTGIDGTNSWIWGVKFGLIVLGRPKTRYAFIQCGNISLTYETDLQRAVIGRTNLDNQKTVPPLDTPFFDGSPPGQEKREWYVRQGANVPEGAAIMFDTPGVGAPAREGVDPNLGGYDLSVASTQVHLLCGNPPEVRNGRNPRLTSVKMQTTLVTRVIDVSNAAVYASVKTSMTFRFREQSRMTYAFDRGGSPVVTPVWESYYP